MDAFVGRPQDDEGNPNAAILDSLRQGWARIGWSSQEGQDLREGKRASREGKLSQEQQYARRCLGFLERVRPGDVLFYPNVPDVGLFVVCEVVEGGYHFLLPSQAPPGTEGDFRSAQPAKLLGQGPVSKDDPRVPPALRNRLGKQGRFSQVLLPFSGLPFHAVRLRDG